MPANNLYSLRNSFVFNRRPVSENEAIRLSRWLDKTLKRKGINNYSIGYAGKDNEFHVELTDRNIIDKITPNPAGTTLPRHR